MGTCSVCLDTGKVACGWCGGAAVIRAGGALARRNKPCPLCDGTGAERCPHCAAQPLTARRTPVPAVRHDYVAHEIVAALGSLPKVAGALPSEANAPAGRALEALLEELVALAGGYVGAERLELERNDEGHVMGAKVTVPGGPYLVVRTTDGSYTWRRLVRGE